MVVRTGPDFVVRWCNKAYARHLGRTREGVIGRAIDELLLPERAQAIRAN
jgi:PAS domain-containing protein